MKKQNEEDYQYWETDYRKKKGIYGIDLIFIMPIFSGIGFVISQINMINGTFIFIAILICFIVSLLIYRLITILLFKRTIGMIICRSVYLNHNYGELNMKERLMTALYLSFGRAYSDYYVDMYDEY